MKTQLKALESKPDDAGKTVEQMMASFPQTTSLMLSAAVELTVVDLHTDQGHPISVEVANVIPVTGQSRLAENGSASTVVFPLGQYPSLMDFSRGVHNGVGAVALAAARRGANLRLSGHHPAVACDPHGGYTAGQSNFKERAIGMVSRRMTCRIRFEVTVNRDSVIRINDGLQRFVPLLVALSANSPLANQQPSDVRTHRAPLESMRYAVSGLSKPYGDWNGFKKHVEELKQAGKIQSASDLHYFIRPTDHGTIEINCCDLPMKVDQIVSLAAIVLLLVEALQDGHPIIGLDDQTLNLELDRAIENGMEAVLTDHVGREGSVLDFLKRLQYDLEPTARRLGLGAAMPMLTSVWMERAVNRPLRDHQNRTVKKKTGLANQFETSTSHRRRNFTTATVAISLLIAVTWLTLR